MNWIWALAIVAGGAGRGIGQRGAWQGGVRRVWGEAAMGDWATPVGGLNIRPTNISAKEYYSLAVENLRTYPVYFPGREPEGYWDMLQHVGPKALIEPEKLKTEADWIEAGRRVFDEADHVHLRTFDPKWIEAARKHGTFDPLQPLPGGPVHDLRWVPTKHGVALSFPDCSGCHLVYLPDGTRVPGAPVTARPNRSLANLIAPGQSEKRVVQADGAFRLSPEPS